jgi:hypothetical protein
MSLPKSELQQIISQLGRYIVYKIMPQARNMLQAIKIVKAKKHTLRPKSEPGDPQI